MMIAPIGYAIYQSFFKLHRSGLGLTPPTQVFAWFANYLDALSDSAFMSSLLRVLILGVIQVPVMLGIALVLALLLDSRSASFKRAFRLIYFLPYALPGVIATIMWSFLLQKDISPFSGLLGHVGLQVDFLSPQVVLASIGNMITWGWTGYNMLVIYSALQAIPAELTDAAMMDGCSGWRLAWHVKVPLVRPALVLTTVFSIIGTAQLYTEPFVLLRIAPSVTANYTPLMAAQHAADVDNYNYAAAESIILALLTLVLSFGFLKFVQRKGVMT
ncbi:MAG: sugar ABC transporter permease [Sciscionella sp.]|nr:sugar ABC transporter permease [Sciscionella sp.]